MAKVIKAESISKAYQLGNFGTGTISLDIERFWARVRGKEDPFFKIGEVNDRTTKGGSDVVWSLKDINFEVEKGDAIGIIGRNGAGKSTLLKILSRVTSPTTGSVKVKGRIASLLEVGTGFHPELSGRENIFLNGAILGMRKAEITRKFDEIVSFANVERYVDTPVKRYSSGMYVRLAFAVAAHLESEILIVDEVLAVGDAEFQKKCLNKMSDVSRSEGRTVLFVSHNMGAIKNLCNDVIILNNGQLDYRGNVNAAINHYLDNQSEIGLSSYKFTGLKELGGFEEVRLENKKRVLTEEFAFDDEIFIVMKLLINNDYLSAKVSVRFTDNLERIVFTTESDIKNFISNAGLVNLSIKVPAKTLVPNRYSVTLALHLPNVQIVDLLKGYISFQVVETGTDYYHYGNEDYGCVFVDCEWSDSKNY
jgi:lipopolysaccharide transport system ATP-binding protein